MKRREFLRTTGTFFATAALAGLPACGDDGGGGPELPPEGTYAFPQGLASGDPRESSVVLWTRVVLTSGAADPVALDVDVATDLAFATIVVTQAIDATAATDHTVRVIISGLAADTTYYYRFVAGRDVISGRTRTAPAADADVPIHLAWVSCQDYTAGSFIAYQKLVAEDQARPEADQIRVVLHMGDFIYETRGGSFQEPLDDNFLPITLTNPDGTPRQIPQFPSGGGQATHGTFAVTLEDYRHLYKVFASDPHLQAARARWPFIHTWDDHEFSNDGWQSQANYTDDDSLDEGSQTRKVAANRAWFEFIPVQLTGAPGVAGVTQRAKDFTPVDVQNAPFTTPNDTNFVPEANNVAAVGSMTIYRSLRFGRHVELVVTDQRSYRSDHAIPEEFADPRVSMEYLDTRNVLPVADLATMDAGKTANGGSPPTEVGLSGFPNPRVASPPGTMLGAEQKAWWKETMMRSTATWKVWANEVPLMRFFIPRGSVGPLIVDRIMDGDAWDGYATERKELGTFIRTAAVRNLLVLTGDIHAHFAGLVHDDYLAATPVPVGVEFCAAGICSNSLFSFFESASGASRIPPDVRAIVTYDATQNGGPKFVENLNLLVMHGANAAKSISATGNVRPADIATAIATDTSPTTTRHLKYADTNSQGYGVALITATQVEATLTTIARPISNAAPVVKRTAKFVVPLNNPGGMTGPVFTGTPPFPFALP